jgi:putative endonuclease
MIDGFSKKYNLNRLVYLEETTSAEAAIQREKQIKNWRRSKKNQLIESYNPKWNDLGAELSEDPSATLGMTAGETK